MTSHPDFDPYCPSGGSWYACGNGTNFVGCCGEYPCTETGCSVGLLYDASFDASKYGSFSDQQCSDGQFYTCTGYRPAFLGCCEVNACQTTSGCPSGSLAAMYLSANPGEADQFDPQPPLSSTDSSSSTVPSTLTASSSSVPSLTTTGSAAAASTTAASSDDHHSTPVGAIVGGAAGGFALLCSIVFVVWRVKCHSRRSIERHSALSELHDSPAGDQNGAQNSNAQDKWITAGIVPMQSPRRDSPSTVPPYPPQRCSQAWSPQMHQGYSQHPHIQGVENQSAFRAYSLQAGSYLPYRPPSQFSPSLSQPDIQTKSDVWGSNSAPDTSQSQYNGSQFARVHQRPPQEMPGSISDGDWPGLGVYHVRETDSLRAELSSG